MCRLKKNVFCAIHSFNGMDDSDRRFLRLPAAGSVAGAGRIGDWVDTAELRAMTETEVERFRTDASISVYPAEVRHNRWIN